MSIIPTTQESFTELLYNTGVYSNLHLSADEDFLVEIAFLNYWNHELEEETGIDGYRFCEYNNSGYDGIRSITVILEHSSGERATLIYALNDDHPSRHSLVIMRDDQVVYSRRSYHNPATEWDINCMAGDPLVTDKKGNILFVGEPTNI